MNHILFKELSKNAHHPCISLKILTKIKLFKIQESTGLCHFLLARWSVRVKRQLFSSMAKSLNISRKHNGSRAGPHMFKSEKATQTSKKERGSLWRHKDFHCRRVFRGPFWRDRAARSSNQLWWHHQCRLCDCSSGSFSLWLDESCSEPVRFWRQQFFNQSLGARQNSTGNTAETQWTSILCGRKLPSYF